MAGNSVPVSFLNPSGNRLAGILHVPDRNHAPSTAIIILSPGIKSRVAPHRLYVKMARNFCNQGFQVLRFDYYGLGDSEGELDERFVADLYGSIQVGRYVQDTIAAMDFLEKAHGVQRFVLTGLCGGAITGLLAMERDQRVDSLLGLGIPVILDSRNALKDKYKYLTTNELNRFRQKYVRKLLSPKSWFRVLMLRSDFRVMAKSVFGPVLASIKRRFAKPAPEKTVESDPPADQAQNTNPYFAGAMRSVLSSGRKVVLLFGETDRLYWEFEAKYYKREAAGIVGLPGRFELRLIPGARHILEERDHQEEAFRQIGAWLEREYVGSSAMDNIKKTVPLNSAAI